MSVFKINTQKLESRELDLHRYKNEGYSKVSPQNLIARFPSLILSLPELEITDLDAIMVAREVNTSRGPIDVLIITKNLDIVLIETKLYRNPESHRTVVAQAIDYAKALSVIDTEFLKSVFLKSEYTSADIAKELFDDMSFQSSLDLSLKTGNFKVLIAGDRIHPNVLNMVDAIQSAPHLAFTLFLAEIQPFELDSDTLLIYPTIVARTNEIERSVIKLEIDYKEKTHTIESSTPLKEGKGNKPILTAEEFLDTISMPEFTDSFRKFWKRWKDLGGDVRFGVTGFSLGITIDGTRMAVQFFYDTNFYLVRTSTITKYGIDDKIYSKYIEYLKISFPKAYDYIVSNKVMLLYSDMSKDELEKVFDGVFMMGKELLNP